MATFDDFQDDLATCPYNPAHKVARRRLQAHIVKCEKNSTLRLMECPFNSSHRMQMHEYQKHLDTCPDSFQVIREIHQQNEMAKTKSEKKEEFVPEKVIDDRDDEWSCNTNNDKNYVIPALKDNVDKLKNRVEGFVDPLLLQRMTRSEKEKFYDQRLQAARIRKEEEEKKHQEYPAEFKLKVKDEGERKVKEEEESTFSPPKNVQTFGGVGRGRPRN